MLKYDKIQICIFVVVLFVVILTSCATTPISIPEDEGVEEYCEIQNEEYLDEIYRKYVKPIYPRYIERNHSWRSPSDMHSRLYFALQNLNHRADGRILDNAFSAFLFQF